MFAVYEILTEKLSGKPQSKWANWTFWGERPCEKRMICTVAEASEAQTRVNTARLDSPNEFFYQEIP